MNTLLYAGSDIADQTDELCINTLRTLSIDTVQKANSGHPGTPMDAAPAVYWLWQHYLRSDPADPDWPNRDRFVLSVGHASALLYSLLHVCQVKATAASYVATKSADQSSARLAVTLDDLKSFRQLGSRCTGHPEYGWTSGVECTTGPLGQGVATSVGLALAQRWLAATYNRPGFDLYDYNVYALCGDGDMMEGISSEAASIAGHLRLSNLCWIYDDNRISIEGSTAITFTEDVAARFIAYGWHVTSVDDANNLQQLDRAYQSFIETKDRPTLIVMHSHIGYGSPHKHDSREAHGEALGEAEVRLTKEFYGCDPDKHFDVPAGVLERFSAQFGTRGAQARSAWQKNWSEYRARYPNLAQQQDCMQQRQLPTSWDSALPSFSVDTKGISTRDSSGQVLNAIATQMPWLLGGAADLAPSTKTDLKDAQFGYFQPPSVNNSDPHQNSYHGRNFHFGVREHAMCAIASGISLSGLRPFAASFFIFTDYCRGALRLAAMMELPVIFIWTHDSILLGEDGPTHQPIEQLASLRAMPGMLVLRPADANEVLAIWRMIMPYQNRPVSLVLTRQALPTMACTAQAAPTGVAHGAYVLLDAPNGKPDVLLLASGSEVALCVAAHQQLAAEGIQARVVSMPSWKLFEEQSPEYRASVIPAEVTARVSVEAAATLGWDRYTGPDGAKLGMHGFGMSAPASALAQHFGFEPKQVVQAAHEQIQRVQEQGTREQSKKEQHAK